MMADPAFILVSMAAVVIAGLAKGGFAGIGVLSMPLLALVMPPLEGAAMLLPILIVQDVVSVWSFRHDWEGWILAVMLPGAAVGILLGYLFASHVPETGILGALGLISILFAGQRLWLGRGGRIAASSRSPWWIGSLFGMATGFTSHVAHAGGPPFQMWVIPRNLPPARFIGTSALTFAAINWMKVPAYIAAGQFDRHTLTITAALLPVALASTFFGVWLVRRVPAQRFYPMIYALLILVGVKLIFDALR